MNATLLFKYLPANSSAEFSSRTSFMTSASVFLLQVPKDSVLQVWLSGQATVRTVNTRGYKALFSSCWYLDRIKRGTQWLHLYRCDPSPYTTGKYKGSRKDHIKRSASSNISISSTLGLSGIFFLSKIGCIQCY